MALGGARAPGAHRRRERAGDGGVSRRRNNAGSLRDRENIVIARLNQLNESATRARTARAQKESLYKQIEALGAGAAAETIPAIASNPYVQSVKATLAELQRQKALLSERYGDKHPEMVTVMASIQDANRQLNIELSKAVEAIRHDYESAVLEERTLAQALSDQQAVAADLDRKGVAYTVLEREAQSNRQLYETLLQREKELQVLANSRGNNVRLIERAAMPSAPFDARHPARQLMLGALAGLLRGVRPGVRARLIRRHHQVGRGRHAQAGTALPGPGAGRAAAQRSPVVSATGPGDFGEAIRSLRTSVAFSSEAERQRRAAGHQRAAARRQDHDGVQPGDGAGVRRRQGAARRRRHAPAQRAQRLRPREPASGCPTCSPSARRWRRRSTALASPATCG